MKTKNRMQTLSERDYRELSQDRVLSNISRNATEWMVNEVTSRLQNFIRSIDGPRRDLNIECGYPREIQKEDYLEQYKRNGVAKRVVKIEPQESWKAPPLVYEDEDPNVSTPFEKAWEELRKEHNVWHYLKRADILSGVGRFGLLLIGVSDDQKLSSPAYKVDRITGKPKLDSVKSKKNKLLYLRPLSEERISELSERDLEDDIGNARYGQPVRYSLLLGTLKRNRTETRVHHTRVLHFADDREDSEIYGTPRMEEVYNNVFDVRKILGGSGEMFYKGGFPGISMELAPGAINQGELVVTVDEKSVRDALERYMEGLQRYLIATGLSAKSLAPAIADPGPHLMAQLNALCIAKGIPVRIFMGSERGELASTQDRVSWNERVRERQLNYLTPMVVIPFIEKMIAMGVLPQPKNLVIDWPDLNAPSDKEKADIGKSRMESLGTYVEKKVNQIVGTKEALIHIMGVPDEVADVLAKSGDGVLSAEDELDNEIKKIEAAAKARKPPEGPGNGRLPNGQPGRTGRQAPRPNGSTRKVRTDR